MATPQLHAAVRPRSAVPARRPTVDPPAPRALPLRQTAGCACGGGCPRCGAGLRLSDPASAPEQQAEDAAQRISGLRSPGGAARQPLPGALQAVAAATAASGQPLGADQRARFEAQLGPLGAVRLHTGAPAAAAAQQLRSPAFSVGPHIGFAAGAFAPATRAGRHLLAHELAHTRQAAAAGPGLVSRAPAAAPQAVADKPTDAGAVPLNFSWKDLAVYPLLVDIWHDLVLKEISPADMKALKLQGSESAPFQAWILAIGLVNANAIGGSAPKDFGDSLKAANKYAEALAALGPQADAVMGPLSRIVGLRLDEYLGSDLFISRLKQHASSVAAVAALAQGVLSLVMGLKDRNTDPNATEDDVWVQHTTLVKVLVDAVAKKFMKAPGFFDVGPMRLALHPAFAAAPFAGGAVPAGLSFERKVDPAGNLRQQKYGFTLNLGEMLKPEGAKDVDDPAKYRGLQSSLWFSYEDKNPALPTPDQQPGRQWKTGTLFGNRGHLGLLETGAQYGGETGQALTSWFVRGGYGWQAPEAANGLRKIGFTATFMDWRSQYAQAPQGADGTPAGGAALQTSVFANARLKLGDGQRLDAGTALSLVFGQVGDGPLSAHLGDISGSLAYVYLGEKGTEQLPAFKVDLSASAHRLDWWQANSPWLWGLQAKVQAGRVFGGAQYMHGAGVQSEPGGDGIPLGRALQIDPEAPVRVPDTLLINGGVLF